MPALNPLFDEPQQWRRAGAALRERYREDIDSSKGALERALDELFLAILDLEAARRLKNDALIDEKQAACSRCAAAVVEANGDLETLAQLGEIATQIAASHEEPGRIIKAWLTEWQ